MGQSRFFNNLFSTAYRECAECISSLLGIKVSHILRTLRRLSNTLLILMTICSTCSVPTNLTTDLGRRITIENSNIQYPTFCRPISYDANGDPIKNLLCSHRRSAGEEPFALFPAHFNMPESLFATGNKMETAECMLSSTGSLGDIAASNTDYASYICHRNVDATRLSHAIYYTKRLFEDVKITHGVYRERWDGLFCSNLNGLDQYCVNPDLVKPFYDHIGDPKAVVESIAEKLSYIEDKSGNTRPWPFGNVIFVQSPDTRSYYIDTKICYLDKTNSDIFSAHYSPCTHSTLASIISTAQGPIGFRTLFVINILCGLASAIHSWWHQHRISVRCGEIIMQAIAENAAKLNDCDNADDELDWDNADDELDWDNADDELDWNKADDSQEG